MVRDPMSDSSSNEYEPPEWPNPEWTPKQQENWEESIKPTYERLETDVARYWFRRTWRPKKRNSGKLKRDHVKLGTPEDYIEHNVQEAFNPWGDLTSVMMRQVGSYDDKDELDDVVEEIVGARCDLLKQTNPEELDRLARESKKVARLYGVEEEVDG